MMKESVYLDNNATTPLRSEVIDAIDELMLLVGNPSSIHSHGRKAKAILENARASVAGLCGAKPETVTFTSGGTEANNLVLRGLDRGRVLVSAIEHPSVSDSCPHAEIIPVTHEGIVDLDFLTTALQASDVPSLVSVMLANNETGIVQPISSISSIAHKYGALVHCDAVQAVGKIVINVSELDVDFLVLSAHKIGGPSGCGALLNLCGYPTAPLTFGGGQERKVRSGTENLIGVAGFGAAAVAVMENGIDEMVRIQSMRNSLEKILLNRIAGLEIVGYGVERLGNTTYLLMPGISSETQVIALDLEGISVSSGSACSSGKVSTSSVLNAMGFNEEKSMSGLRVSFGWANVEEDVDLFVEAFTAVCERIGNTGWSDSIYRDPIMGNELLNGKILRA